jgi:hypothetical protein
LVTMGSDRGFSSELTTSADFSAMTSFSADRMIVFMQACVVESNSPSSTISGSGRSSAYVREVGPDSEDRDFGVGGKKTPESEGAVTVFDVDGILTSSVGAAAA